MSYGGGGARSVSTCCSYSVQCTGHLLNLNGLCAEGLVCARLGAGAGYKYETFFKDSLRTGGGGVSTAQGINYKVLDGRPLSAAMTALHKLDYTTFFFS